MGIQLWLILLGFALGGLGTLIGAGGGFILVPALILLYPQYTPETITSISLAVIFFNAFSGSCAYARMRRIDYKSGILFAVATIPGAIAGVLTIDYIPRREFNIIFGFLLIAAALYLLFFRAEEKTNGTTPKKGLVVRNITDKKGNSHQFSYDLKLGMGLSIFVGYISSLLGIGGGIIHVPALVRLLNYPVHIATATSHFILAIMALTGTVVHILTGSFSQDSYIKTILLGIGVVFGAQGGALLSSRVKGNWIIRSLSFALLLVSIRILIVTFKN